MSRKVKRNSNYSNFSPLPYTQIKTMESIIVQCNFLPIKLVIGENI